MIRCYAPSYPAVRIGEPPSDVGTLMVLLHRRFWLLVRFEGLRTKPRIIEATIKMRGYGQPIPYSRPFPIDRLSLVDKPLFDVWYADHWQRFHTAFSHE